MNETIKKIIEHNAFQMAIILGGVAITLVNTYIAFKLVPLETNIQSIASKVQAIETRNKDADLLIGRFLIVEDRTKDIRERLIRIEDKIDSLR